MSTGAAISRLFRVAVEGCGHGCLNDIYAAVDRAASLKGWDNVDLVIIGGDFQALRNSYDLACIAVPQKYKAIGDFHEYYSGKRTAPYLTIFIGGNHEASNYLSELYYGGWAAPSIYYLGAANVIRCGPLRIAGMSGIWKPYDFRKPHFERLPYNDDDLRTIFHTRELDVRKLLQIRTQVDLGLSHDWPQGVEYFGNYERLFHQKRGFREDSESGTLGSFAAKLVLERLRPAYWFSAHLHVKFSARIKHQSETQESVVISAAASASEDRPIKSTSPRTTNVSPLDQGAAQSPIQPQTAHTSHQPITDLDSASAKVSLSAWKNFHEVVAKEEAAEHARLAEEYQQHQQLGFQSSETDYNLTWRKVNISSGGSVRKVSSRTESADVNDGPNKKQKIEEGEAGNFRNSDEIDLDLDSGSDEEAAATLVALSTANSSDKPVDGACKAEAKENDDYISADIRSKLPESFTHSEPAAARQEIEPVVNEPIPCDISNNVTEFLALDKCLPKREYLQLLELHIISDQHNIPEDRPYRLQYDPEWLAITRVFANDLKLGDIRASVPKNKGTAFYRPLINNEEEWVEDNVVKQGKLEIPENFTPTAPFYDPAVPITTQQMPPEYNNPQTAQFCELVGIKNEFFLTGEERRARIEAGPRPNASRHPGQPRGRRGGRFGRRGG